MQILRLWRHRKRGTSRARVQSRPGTYALLTRRRGNDGNDEGEDEGKWGARGAVQDPTEGSYEPRPKSDVPVYEPYDSDEEDSGNNSMHNGSHFDSDDESINPEND
jgi:hypothetical protein